MRKEENALSAYLYCIRTLIGISYDADYSLSVLGNEATFKEVDLAIL